MANGKPAIAFIGFGEAGQAIAAGLHETGAAEMTPWDILFPRAEGMSLRRAAEASGVRCARSAADAVKGAQIVISAVTAASSLEAAQSVNTHLTGSPFFLDINSVSPGRKQDAAKFLGKDARYLDVAVLAPIHPARHQTPMLLGGPHSKAAEPALAALGMRTSIAGAEIGAAAAIKMVRSVIIKGIEALTLECFLAAARAGVIDEVAVSMKNNYPGLEDSPLQSGTDGHSRRTPRRRDGGEVAATLRELGVEPLMTNATVKRQREMGQIGRQQSVRSVLKEDRAAMLGAISAAARDRH